MIYEKIYLKDEYEILKNSDAYIEIYAYGQCLEYPEDYKRYPMLVVAGGGYDFVSDREKIPSAFAFLAHGFNCVSLNYSCKTAYPIPHIEVACAMDYIHNHADKYGFRVDKKCMVGYSAGGHLVASYSTVYKEIAELAHLNPDHIKPYFQILSYPVISLGEYSHEATRINISNNDSAIIDKLSVEKHITSDYTPTYIWTTNDDTCVNPINSTMIVEELEKHNVPHQFHLYPHGIHGRSICTNETEQSFTVLEDYLQDIHNWLQEAINFFYSLK